MRTIKNIIATDFDRVVRPAYAIIEVDRKGQITVWNVFNDLDIARKVMENIRKDEKPEGKLEIARNEWVEEWNFKCSLSSFGL